MPEAVERSWIVALPKAEVHLHLEGCIDSSLVNGAARRHGVAPFAGTGTGGADGEAPAVTISSLPQLLSYLDWSCALIDRPDDLAAVAYGAARRAASSGVGHIDVIVNPTHWPHWRGRLDAMIDALDGGFRAAETDGLATAVLCVSVKRSQTGSEALALVDWILARRHPRVAALSIDGDESSGSHNERFAEAFARAGRGGLRRCAHAGESSGPAGVREAVDVLGAERIDHGVRAVADPGLVAELARRSIPLDICPTSNVVLGIVPDLAHHPVDDLRRHGVTFSLNTDDPVLYGADVAGEYALCAQTFSWGRPELVAVARTSIESSFAGEDRRRDLLRELDSFVDAQGGDA
ncbi:MAG TPA: adenosine deaminase [Acidimicrobiales bacterium]|nr:adenosine deaminase [Acidimicrobiales bacterium]